MRVFFSQIQVLNLSFNKIRDIRGVELAMACPNLRELYLAYNRMTDLKQFLDLARMSSLEVLHFQHNPIPGISKRVQTLDYLLLTGIIQKYTVNEKRILNSYYLNTMAPMKELINANVESHEPAPVPRLHGNFR